MQALRQRLSWYVKLVRLDKPHRHTAFTLAHLECPVVSE